MGTFGLKLGLCEIFEQEAPHESSKAQRKEVTGPVKGSAEGRPQFRSTRLGALCTVLPQLTKFTARKDSEGRLSWD